MSDTRKQLRRAVCGACMANNWIPGDLAPLETVPCSKCHHPVILPTKIHQFELREVVASGGMGTVYRSMDVNLERIVAVKLMKREIAEDKEAMASFYREARAGAALNHQNIIHIYTFDEFEGRPFLVMELADHGSLDSLIEKNRTVEEVQVLDVGIAMCSALESALKRNFLHRDIKPGNILFNAEGEPKLVDFGLAREAEITHEAEGSVWGTPYYIAPEKVKREGETFHSDMYSLGGTLYHALTGHVPFEAEDIEAIIKAHIETPLTPPISVRPDITQQTNDALVQAMAKSPQERFETYFEFRMALESARTALLFSIHRPGEPEKGFKSWFRR
ncbi:MAG TPA: serine/threonine protein kinase [Verrucomicrobiales bacterium]|nr:serine/threonine protein kinase [Verrucomicrobiales bacterium]